MNNREVPDEDDDMLLVKGEDGKENDDDTLEYMYGGAFSLFLAKQECNRPLQQSRSHRRCLPLLALQT